MKYSVVSAGESPVSVDEVKSYLKLSSSIDDALIRTLIAGATQLGEQYTSRDFRVNTWEILFDYMTARNKISLFNAESIAKIEYLKDSSLTPIDSTIYYLKNLPHHAEILLFSDKDWPVDGDIVEHSFRVEILTSAWEYIDQAKIGLLKHITHMYINRGDCKDSQDSIFASGAASIYDQFIIPRI